MYNLKQSIYCLKANSDFHSELCEECDLHTNCDHFIQDNMTEIAIRCLEMLYKFDEELDKHYIEKEGKVQDNLAEGFMQCEKLVKRRIKEIEKEIEE